MPKIVVSYECSICQELFSGQGAWDLACKCEKLGRPKYAFKIGQTFYAVLFGRGRQVLKISKRGAEYNKVYDRHVPIYKIIVVATGLEIEYWHDEEKIERLIEECSQK